jgi:hypothetical protein
MGNLDNKLLTTSILLTNYNRNYNCTKDNNCLTNKTRNIIEPEESFTTYAWSEAVPSESVSEPSEVA